MAFEHGAVGPSKDCAYENPIIKAITGCPISMEGKSAACAHFSPLGNIASAMCDLWSNESVPERPAPLGQCPGGLRRTARLRLSPHERGDVPGPSPVASRLADRIGRMAQPAGGGPLAAGRARIAAAIVGTPGDYPRTIAAGQAATEILKEGHATDRLKLVPKERRWLGRIEEELAALPADEDEFRREMTEHYGHLFDPSSYGLPGSS